MTTISDPRLRSLLRQAERTANAGKRAAAEQLYRQLLDEAPHSADAWVGLSSVMLDPLKQEEALAQALTLDPKNEVAQLALARLHGEVVAEVEEDEVVKETAVFQPVDTSEHPHTIEEMTETLVCYRHSSRETNLRCNKCNKPICTSCAQKTAVGYRCSECIREIEAGFFTATTKDYLLVPVVLLPLSLIVGSLVIRFGGFGGIFFLFIMFAIAGAIGGWLGRIGFRVAGRRRGRYLPYIVASCVILGILIPAAVTFFLFGAWPGFIGPGIYLFAATTAAYSQSR